MGGEKNGGESTWCSLIAWVLNRGNLLLIQNFKMSHRKTWSFLIIFNFVLPLQIIVIPLHSLVVHTKDIMQYPSLLRHASCENRPQLDYDRSASA